MPFSVRVQLYDGQASRPKQLPLPWWNKDELMSQYPFHGVYDEGFFEYFLEVDKEQLKTIFEQQLPHIEEGVYADEDHRGLVLPLAEKMKRIINSGDCYKTIQVNLYES